MQHSGFHGSIIRPPSRQRWARPELRKVLGKLESTFYAVRIPNKEAVVNADTTTTTDEARVMLDRVGQLGAGATAGASWPHIATLLTLGAATSMGTLAMGLTTGAGYVIATIAMCVWVLASIIFMLAFGRSTRLGFKKRWPAYMIAWGIAYVIAILLVSGSNGQNIVGAVVGAALIAVVTVAGAVIEARS
jgi:hypothetical protein